MGLRSKWSISEVLLHIDSPRKVRAAFVTKGEFQGLLLPTSGGILHRSNPLRVLIMKKKLIYPTLTFSRLSPLDYIVRLDTYGDLGFLVFDYI